MTNPLPVDPWADPPAPAAEPQQANLGIYEILGPLGQGGMGTVYKARHRQLGVVRAVKVVTGLSGNALGRFQRETRSLAKVQHPNVATIHEVGMDKGRPWYSMELVEGQPLDEVLEGGRLDLERALGIAIGVCDGVAALHALGIIHRDLKPANVVLTGSGRPVVIDLGLAVAPEQDERLTKTGTMVGTLTYMAPEQFGKAKQVTPATDVYALGCIVFELTTGQPVIDPDEGIHAIAARVLSQERPAPSSVDSQLPVQLDAVCARAMSREMQPRYADASELADALREVMHDPGASRRSRRMGIVAAVGLVLAVGAAVALALGPSEPEPKPEPEPEAVEQKTAEPTPPPRKTRAPSAHVLAGRKRLEEIRILAPPERLTAIEKWRRDYPDHPDASVMAGLRAKTLLRVPLRRLSRNGRMVRFVDDDHVVVGRGDGLSKLRDLRDGKVLGTWNLGKGIFDVAVAPDGKRFVMVGAGHPAVMEVDLSSRRQRVLWRAPSGGHHRAVYSPDGKLLALAGPPGTSKGRYIRWSRLVLLELPSGRVRATIPFERFPKAILNMEFSPRGRILAIACGPHGRDKSRGGVIVLFDIERQAEIRRIGITGIPYSVSFLPNGERFAVVDGPAIALYPADQEGPAIQLKGSQTMGDRFARAAHNGQTRHVAFSSTRFCSVSMRANELRVWDTATLEEIHKVVGLRENPARVAVSPNGQRALVVGDRRTVDQWELGGLSAP